MPRENRSRRKGGKDGQRGFPGLGMGSGQAGHVSDRVN